MSPAKACRTSRTSLTSQHPWFGGRRCCSNRITMRTSGGSLTMPCLTMPDGCCKASIGAPRISTG
eukprot:CAMPEP_0198121132 /NCGR_PEP_ID=MMETSP1442-20131203/31269_1 /TAXON_ID= /ORGANISM="Craspedostauros australis, Strain CCMP3328" /LENGTH=64 /DNA_ID=CAMNT_0043779895 /DNA_START=195 /DNA_END=389 /DNA_ORIENTATION=+